MSNRTVKSPSTFPHKNLCSQLFEGTASCLTICCRLYVFIVTFKNNIQEGKQSLNTPEIYRKLRLLDLA